MAQDGTTAGGSSYTIDNVTFPVGRTKLQSIFDAIRSTNIGNTAPDLVAGQFWIDNNTPSTTIWTLYFYDGTDNISFATIDTINNTVNFLDSTFDLINDSTPQLGGTLDSNGNNIDMGTNLITDTKVGQWDTAYSWGDHSTEGYITASSTDTLINKSGNISQWTNDAGYLTSETDSQTLSFSNPNLTISNGNSVDLSALDTGILNVVEDTTPQLGGDLDLNSSDVTGTGNVNITGTITSTGDITTSGVLNSIAPTRHSIRPSLNLDFANSKVLDPRITFTRGSNATYYDGYTSVKAEENLLEYSQDFSGWVGLRGSRTVNATTAPDGTTTADELYNSGSTANTVYYQNIQVIGNQNYVYSFYAKSNGKDYCILSEGATPVNSTTTSASWINLTNGTVGTEDSDHNIIVTDVGNGWYRISTTLTAYENRNASFRIETAETDNSRVMVDDGQGIYVWGGQLEQRDSLTAYTPTTSSPITKYQPALQTAGNNVARFDHNPTTGESLGLLIEESRTNLTTYSEDLTQTDWNKGNATITSNTTIAPDGTLTADKLVEDTSTNSHNVGNVYSFVAGTTYTGTIYAKKAERTLIRFGGANPATWSASIDVDLSNGTIVGGSNGTITDVGNGWYRISVTGDALVSAATNFMVRLLITTASSSYTGDGYSGAYIWGAQLEEGSFPTSYIKTTGSQVTRSADDSEMENIDTSDWFKQGVGTMYVEAETSDVTYNQRFWTLSDGTTANRILSRSTTSNNNILIYNFGGTLQASLSQSISNNTYFKSVLSYTNDNTNLSVDGNAVSNDSAGTIPIVDRLNIGNGYINSNTLNGHIKKLSYYPIALTDNEIIDLTEE